MVYSVKNKVIILLIKDRMDERQLIGSKISVLSYDFTNFHKNIIYEIN
jgi:hypothetical protein